MGAAEPAEGLVMAYFDSRGVRRTYGVLLDDGVLRMGATTRVRPALPGRARP
jgi:hypothetical protein